MKNTQQREVALNRIKEGLKRYEAYRNELKGLLKEKHTDHEFTSALNKVSRQHGIVSGTLYLALSLELIDVFEFSGLTNKLIEIGEKFYKE